MADAFLGRYHTIWVFTVCYLVGVSWPRSGIDLEEHIGCFTRRKQLAMELGQNVLLSPLDF